ncbi:MAG: molybdenum cofactor guanylyltransferase [Atribacterota bacterium]|nr:molybdenum cofactor guanylyltransferase [Atribacterota bacterium]
MEGFKRNRTNAINAIILAGGRSTRIGLNKDKSKMKLMGISLLDRVIANILASKYFKEDSIIIIGPKDKYQDYKRVFEDIYPQKGPLGGILTGLLVSDAFYNLIVGCDMPFIRKELIGLLLQNISIHDIIIPGYGRELFEPLCAVYSKKCIDIIEKNIKDNKLAVKSIFPYLNVKIVEEHDIKKIDPELISFFNINFKNDFYLAKDLDLKRGKRKCNDLN